MGSKKNAPGSAGSSTSSSAANGKRAGGAARRAVKKSPASSSLSASSAHAHHQHNAPHTNGSLDSSPTIAFTSESGTESGWSANARKMVVAIGSSKQTFTHWRAEVVEVLQMELRRMPVVRALIRTHFSSLGSLQMHLVSKVSHLPDSVREHLASLPDVRAMVHDHLEHMPGWRAHFEMHAPTFLQNPSLFSSTISSALSSLLQQGIPAPLALQLHSLPSVSSALTSTLDTTEEMLSVLQSSFSHASVLDDVAHLVCSNIDSLPDLQGVLMEHYGCWRPKLKTFQHLPQWLQDNDHLHTGHRPPLLSIRRCFQSLLYVHNETGNIYTHLVGALMFLALGVYSATWLLNDRPLMDRVIFGGFCLSALLCLGCSAFFHCLLCHSQKMNSFVSKLDYVGITFLIIGSVCSLTYFLHYCHDNVSTYYTLAMLALGSGCVYVSFSDEFSLPSTRWVRATLFLCLALFGIVPVVHYQLLYGPYLIWTTADLITILFVSGPLYLLGVAIFVMRWPECMFPGRFDYWLHSHQLWHVCVILAAMAHYMGVYNMLEHRLHFQCKAELGLLD